MKRDKKRYITRDEINKKGYKNKHTFSQNGAKDYCIQTLLNAYKNEKNNFFFHKQRKSYKKRIYNRITLTTGTL